MANEKSSCSTCSSFLSTSGPQPSRGCCDASCIEKVATRDCEASCLQDAAKDPTTYGGKATISQCAGATRRPCKLHLKSAREIYQPVLEALGCICSALIARHAETCCATSKGRGSSQSAITRPSDDLSDVGARNKKVGACCSEPRKTAKWGAVSCTKGCESDLPAETNLPSCCIGKVNRTCNCRASRSGKDDKVEHGTCGGTDKCEEFLTARDDSPPSCNNDIPSSSVKTSCCGSNAVNTPKSSGCDVQKIEKESCCSKDPTKSTQIPISYEGITSRDLEKGGPRTERVVLAVEGLTCTGCETKLTKALASMSSVANLQTSLVLSRAEFDLDTNSTPLSQLVESLERATGFGCTAMSTTGQHLDVVTDIDADAFVKQSLPLGVSELSVLAKRKVRISYNPRLTGARRLLRGTFGTPVHLCDFSANPALAAGKKHLAHTLYMTLFSAACTIPVLVLAWAPLPPNPVPYQSTSLALATLVQVVVAGPFYSSALRSLVFTRVIEMDILIVVSTTTAYVFSVVSYAYFLLGQPLPTGQFFQTSTLLVTLIMVGRYVSAYARQSAVESVSVRSLQSSTALLVNKDAQPDQEIDARLLEYGDVFRVPPESRIVTDGTVISGQSEVDESTVTGEAIPVYKSPDSTVIAGSLNGSGMLLLRLTRLPGENSISNIANMVDEAKFTKPKVQEIADKVAGYFVPVVLVLALITFGVWIAVGKTVRQHKAPTAVVQALSYAISVLIVSCPCAIGLAVPMVIVIASGVAAKRGVIFKSSLALEIARKVTHVVLDKTGTLTTGDLSVTKEVYTPNARSTATGIILGLVSGSKHPVSVTIARHLTVLGIQPAQLQLITSIPGKGIEGRQDGKTYRGGSPSWLGVEHEPDIQDLLSMGSTVFCVTEGTELLAAFSLQDSLRTEAPSFVSILRKRGIAVSVISGDEGQPVRAVASQLQIPLTHVRSRYKPADKQDYVKTLISNSRETVLFCGDGTNDAVALAQAHVGVHMSGGTVIAESAADVVLVKNSLEAVLDLIDISKAAYRRIVFNFAWAALYNVFAVLLAAGAFPSARISPQFAGLGELVSVLPVVLIALQLKWAYAWYRGQRTSG